MPIVEHGIVEHNLTLVSIYSCEKAPAKLTLACGANESNKRTKQGKTRSTERHMLITICLATYVQRRIERREKLPPRKVPTHLEITGKKSVTNGVAWDVSDGIKINFAWRVKQHSCTLQRYFYSLSLHPFFFCSLFDHCWIAESNETRSNPLQKWATHSTRKCKI